MTGMKLTPEDFQKVLEDITMEDPKDTHFRHAGKIALRNQLAIRTDDWPSLYTALPAAQMSLLSEVCLGLPNSTSAQFLLSHGTSNTALEHIARYGDVNQQKCLQTRFQDKADPWIRTAQLRAIQQGWQKRGQAINADWLPTANQCCEAALADPKSTLAGLELARSWKLEAQLQRVLELLASTKEEPLVKEALATVLVLKPSQAVKPMAAILQAADKTLGLRQQAAQSLGQLGTNDARSALVQAIGTAPAPLQKAIAQALVMQPAGCELLLTTIEQGKASPRLLQEPLLVTALKPYADRISKLTAGLPTVDQKMAELLNQRKTAYTANPGDALAGQKVYSQNCAICHQLGGQGAKYAPQLDGIGSRGLDRIFEDVLDPNRNVDAAFRQTIIQSKNGQTLTGLLTREEGETVVLVDAYGKEMTLSKADIESRKFSNYSPMPANINEKISEEEFRNLMSYLLKQGTNK
jgi:putative heme-binding domain-containing protein